VTADRDRDLRSWASLQSPCAIVRARALQREPTLQDAIRWDPPDRTRKRVSVFRRPGGLPWTARSACRASSMGPRSSTQTRSTAAASRCRWCSTARPRATTPDPSQPRRRAPVRVAGQLRAAGSGASHSASGGTGSSTSRTQAAPKQSPTRPGPRPRCEAIRFARRRSSSMLMTIAWSSRSSFRANRLRSARLVAAGTLHGIWHCGTVAGSRARRFAAYAPAFSRVCIPHTRECACLALRLAACDSFVRWIDAFQGESSANTTPQPSADDEQRELIEVLSVSVCKCACVHACVRACVRACVCAHTREAPLRGCRC